MKSLFTSSLVLAAAGVVWFQQQDRVRRLRTQELGLVEEVAGARLDVDRMMLRQQELETTLGRLRGDLQAQQARLVAPPPPAAAPARDWRRNPDLEGRFPTNRPYFYLPKALLSNFDLEPFEDGQLTAAAAVLFQLTETERLALNEAYVAREDRIIELECSKVERVEPPERLPGQGDPTFVVARLPSMAVELAELDSRFRMEVITVLGEDRAKRFLEHADAQAAIDGPVTQPASREYVLCIPTGASPTLTIRFRSDARLWWHSQTYELASAYGLSPFRHLFREPLVLPNP